MNSKLRESTTLKLVFASWLIITLAFMFTYIASFMGKEMGPITLTEYAASVGVVLTIWLGREWRAAHYKETKDVA